MEAKRPTLRPSRSSAAAEESTVLLRGSRAHPPSICPLLLPLSIFLSAPTPTFPMHVHFMLLFFPLSTYRWWSSCLHASTLLLLLHLHLSALIVSPPPSGPVSHSVTDGLNGAPSFIVVFSSHLPPAHIHFIYPSFIIHESDSEREEG